MLRNFRGNFAKTIKKLNKFLLDFKIKFKKIFKEFEKIIRKFCEIWQSFRKFLIILEKNKPWNARVILEK